MSFSVLNILDIMEDSGEDDIRDALSAFSCPANLEIEDFARNKAIEFAKRKLSVSYIVFDNADSQIVGYFTLTHKALDIKGTNLSNTNRRKLGNVCAMLHVDFTGISILRFEKNEGACTLPCLELANDCRHLRGKF